LRIRERKILQRLWLAPMWLSPLSGGQTVQAEKTDITVNQQGSAIIHMPAGTKLSEVVKALNTLGATPLDLLTILQAMKSAGALHAELEVI
jgi:flagellar P-ring protein precursor FlgI